MTRWIVLVGLLLALGVSELVTTSVDAQRPRRRETTNMRELQRAVMDRSASDEARLKAIAEIGEITSAPDARGIGAVYVEWFGRSGPGLVSTALELAMRGITHESTLIGLREDVVDIGTDAGLRIEWFRANLSLNTADANTFIVGRADDQLPTIRVFAIDAIGSRYLEEGWNSITQSLSDKGSWRVRVSAIKAVVAFIKRDGGKYQKTGIDALMETLFREQGAVRSNVMDALKEVSGEDYGQDEEAWRAWYRRFRESGDVGTPDSNRPRSNRPYGIGNYSMQLIFVIDTSTSMRAEIELDEVRRIKTGGDKGKDEPEEDGDIDWDKVKTRLDLARAELIRSVRRLPDEAYFNIINYDTDVHVWKPELVKADKRTKDEAVEMLKTLKTSRLTNIYGALDEAFKIAEKAIREAEAQREAGGRRPRPAKGGSGTREIPPDVKVPDTIFFLSDGFATTGEYKGEGDEGGGTREQTIAYHKRMDEMLAVIAERNKNARLRIHTIGVGREHDRWTLEKLAKQNGGTYVAIGMGPPAGGK